MKKVIIYSIAIICIFFTEKAFCQIEIDENYANEKKRQIERILSNIKDEEESVSKSNQRREISLSSYISTTKSPSYVSKPSDYLSEIKGDNWETVYMGTEDYEERLALSNYYIRSKERKFENKLLEAEQNKLRLIQDRRKKNLTEAYNLSPKYTVQTVLDQTGKTIINNSTHNKVTRTVSESLFRFSTNELTKNLTDNSVRTSINEAKVGLYNILGIRMKAVKDMETYYQESTNLSTDLRKLWDEMSNDIINGDYNAEKLEMYSSRMNQIFKNYAYKMFKQVSTN